MGAYQSDATIKVNSSRSPSNDDTDSTAQTATSYAYELMRSHLDQTQRDYTRGMNTTVEKLQSKQYVTIAQNKEIQYPPDSKFASLVKAGHKVAFANLIVTRHVLGSGFFQSFGTVMKKRLLIEDNELNLLLQTSWVVYHGKTISDHDVFCTSSGSVYVITKGTLRTIDARSTDPATIASTAAASAATTLAVANLLS